MDAFVSAVGSGGTITGVGAFLKERKPDIRIALADPMGAALYSWFTTGVMQGTGLSITEGIGVARITGNLEGFTPDYSYQIPDEEFLPIVFDLIREEGCRWAAPAASTSPAPCVWRARSAPARPLSRPCATRAPAMRPSCSTPIS